jgi:lipopolysaccharide biosynthesis regulator YciM
MKGFLRASAKGGLGAGYLALALATALAQNPPQKPSAGSSASARNLMIQKGHLLEARGRPDLAVQVWQQILLSDPKNAEALAGMARDGQPVPPGKPNEKPSQAEAKPANAVTAKPQTPLETHAQIAAPAHAAAAPVHPPSANQTHASREPGRPAAQAAPPVQAQAKPVEPKPTPAKPAEPKPAEKAAAAPHVSPEQAAYAALHGKRLDEAEKLFAAILSQDRNNARAAAGMGLVRVEQANFPDAIDYLKRAQANGDTDRSVDDALNSAQFSAALAGASTAANTNHLDAAATLYQQALAIHPHAPDALRGLASLLVKQSQYATAAPVYEQLVKAEPNSAENWRGLFLSDARGVGNQQALDAEARMPAAVKSTLARDPEYLHTLAAVYQAENRVDDAQRVLALEVKLPMQENAAAPQIDAKFEYASMLMDEKRYDQAAAVYAQLAADGAASLPAWLGLVNAHHLMDRDEQALIDVKQMPPADYQAALMNVGFLTRIAAIDENSGQLEAAQGLLERAASLESAGGRHPTVSVELQLARIELARGNADAAVEVFRQSSVAAPERADAWRGLIFSLAALRHDEEAARQIALIPEPVRRQLDGDIGFVETEASLYAFTGDTLQALESMARVKAYFAGQHAEMPAYLAVEYAQLLYSAQEDRLLYAELTRLGVRTDLNASQRATTRQIWADWSVRRAATAVATGETERAADILDAALLAFPENMSVRQVMAETLVRAGQAKEALALYKTVPMQSAPAAEFEAAVSTALAANDKVQAEQWLRQSLPKFPRDATLLALAGRYEQSIGETDRAAEYLRAALAISPTLSPAELPPASPTPDAAAAKEIAPRPAVTAADLPRLLDPAGDFAADRQARPASPAPVLAASAAPASRPSGKPTQVWPQVDAAESHSDAPIVVVSDSSSTMPQPAHQKSEGDGRGDGHGDGHGSDLSPPHIFPPSASHGVSPAPVFVPPAQ